MQVFGAVSSLNWEVSYEAAVCEHHSHHFHFSFFQKNVNQKKLSHFFKTVPQKVVKVVEFLPTIIMYPKSPPAPAPNRAKLPPKFVHPAKSATRAAVCATAAPRATCAHSGANFWYRPRRCRRSWDARVEFCTDVRAETRKTAPHAAPLRPVPHPRRRE